MAWPHREVRRLTNVLAARGLSMRYQASLAGCTANTLGVIRRGRRPARLEYIDRLRLAELREVKP